MDSQGRFVLFVILAMLVLGLGTFFMPSSPNSISTNNGLNNGTNSSPSLPSNHLNTNTSSDLFKTHPGVFHPPTTNAPSKEVRVDTKDYTAVFSTQGAVLTSFQLKKYLNRQTHQPIELVNVDPNHPKPFSIDYAPLPDINEQNFTVGSDSVSLTKENEAVTLVFRLINKDGIIFQKTFYLQNGNYLVGLDLSVEKQNGSPVQAADLSVEWPDTLGKEENTGTQSRVSGYRVITLVGDHKDSQSAKKSQEVVEIPAPVNWTALINQFFMAALIPDPSSGGASVKILRDFNVYKTPTPDNPTPGLDTSEFTPRPVLVFAGQTIKKGEGFQRKLQAFIGPQDYSLLQSLHLGLENAVDFGWFGGISIGMLALLKWFFVWSHNWGLAIILLSLTVKLVLWFPTHSSYKNMNLTQQKMRELQPKMDAIKRKYADLRQKKADLTKYPGEQQEVAALYQQAGLNPMSGCLPMLLQLPVFWALYSTLSHCIELRGAPFLWIGDLTLKDPFYVLPLLMGGTMFLQQKVSGQMASQAAGQQKFMMWFFPLFLTFFSFQWPSGLLLYWVVTNLLSMIQQKVVNQEIRRAKKKDEVVKA